jgi:hypothetical protein
MKTVSKDDAVSQFGSGASHSHVAMALLSAALLAVALLAGCGSTRGGGGGSMMDPNMTRSGAPASSEMAQLCDLHRQMAGKTPEAQDAMLETHMQAAHGAINPQAMALHRQTMLRDCSGR